MTTKKTGADKFVDRMKSDVAQITKNEDLAMSLEFDLEDLIDPLPAPRNQVERDYRYKLNLLAETYQQLNNSYRAMVLQ